MLVNPEGKPDHSLTDALLDAILNHLMLYHVAVVGLPIGAMLLLWPVISSQPNRLVFTIVGLAFFICTAITLPLMALQQRGAVASIDQGEIWAAWTYPKQQYRSVHGRMPAPWDSTATISAWGPFAIALVFILVFSAVLEMFLAGILLAISVAMLGAIVAVPNYRRQRQRKALFAGGIKEVFIGPAGLYADGVHIPVVKVGMGLKEVTFDPGPPALLTFISAYYRQGRQGFSGTHFETGHEQVISLPVPEERVQEAAALAERFQRTITPL